VGIVVVVGIVVDDGTGPGDVTGVRGGGRCARTVVGVVRDGTVVVVVDVEVVVVVVEVVLVVDVALIVDVVSGGLTWRESQLSVTPSVTTVAACRGCFGGRRVPPIAPPWTTPKEHRPANAMRPTQPRRARDVWCLARSCMPVFIDGYMPDMSGFQPSVCGTGQSGVAVSAARQQYQATSDRYGRKGSPRG
jgi:hypothetical protein